MAKLTGGVAVIRVGASTETELKYMKDKMEDAVAATKAAIEEGIVAGGGTALAKAAALIAMKNKSVSDDHEFKAGYETVLKALYEPLRQIALNAGEQDAAVVLHNVIESKLANFGYNAKDNRYENDMLKAGIIDPLKVTRTALENAVSVAALLLTTEAAVVDEEKEESVAGANPMAGMM
jgi:chaperonin GroEL